MRNPILTQIGGKYERNPSKVILGTAAEALVTEAFRGLDGFYDYHMHLLGLGKNRPETWVNPSVFSLTHPMDWIKAKIFLNASGVRTKKNADEQYLDQLIKFIQDIPFPGKYCLFAWDKCYDLDGEVSYPDTKVYISNEYVYRVCMQMPGKLIPVVSIHPYRADALQELDKWAKLGVKMIKWIPATMGMDPSHPRCAPFYQRIRELDMVLLSHAGKEENIPVRRFQELNNPLLFRLPLEIGVKLVLAHCAGKGKGKDLDDKGKPVDNYKLFYRLMDEPRYEHHLYGDVSAMVQVNRCGEPLQTTFDKKEHHHRLLYGSDYPLPAINSLISLNLLQKLKYLDRGEVKPLREIYRKNPLLFSFVLYRRLRDPKMNSYRFPDTMFASHPALEIKALTSSELAQNPVKSVP
ncbi:amidohydrolase family protein [Negadavirga shengliensis]|uniref:Amidohydrolase family protein n=1 Tax=Negadavirga shengliensis TaxID=1389218 RepID=A0ABV9T341_9BACT